MPKTYALPGETNFSAGMTHYQVFVGPGAAFEPRKLQVRPPAGSPVPGWKLSDFPDGTSNTILIATSATAVPWTKPDDMPFDPAGPLPPLGGYLRRGNNVALADGSVRTIDRGRPRRRSGPPSRETGTRRSCGRDERSGPPLPLYSGGEGLWVRHQGTR